MKKFAMWPALNESWPKFVFVKGGFIWGGTLWLGLTCFGWIRGDLEKIGVANLLVMLPAAYLLGVACFGSIWWSVNGRDMRR